MGLWATCVPVPLSVKCALCLHALLCESTLHYYCSVSCFVLWGKEAGHALTEDALQYVTNPPFSRATLKLYVKIMATNVFIHNNINRSQETRWGREDLDLHQKPFHQPWTETLGIIGFSASTSLRRYQLVDINYKVYQEIKKNKETPVGSISFCEVPHLENVSQH